MSDRSSSEMAVLPSFCTDLYKGNDMSGNACFRGRYLAITYPRTEITLDEFKVRLTPFIARVYPFSVAVCRETHKDGGHHLHVFMDLGGVKRGDGTTRPRIYFRDLTSLIKQGAPLSPPLTLNNT